MNDLRIGPIFFFSGCGSAPWWTANGSRGFAASVIQDTTAFFGADPARPQASSCQLESAVSLVPNCEGPGAPSSWSGKGTVATRPYYGHETGIHYRSWKPLSRRLPGIPRQCRRWKRGDIFCGPPFNLKKDYGSKGSDDIPVAEYLRWCETWLAEGVRVLAPGGALFVYNLPKWLMPIGTFLGSLPSKLNNSATDTSSASASSSKFSKDGELLPRSIRLRKSTEIPARSASCSWVRLRSLRIERTFWPNFSRSWETSFRPRTW